MAGEEENEDFDAEMGDDEKDTGKDKAGSSRVRDDEDDDLEDLSREELYDRLKEANGTAKKYRLRLKRARGGDRVSSRRDSRKDDDRDEKDDDRRDGRRERGRDDDRDSRRDDRRRDRDDDRDSRESEDRAIRAEAKVALAAAGISAERLNRAVRLIETRNLELDGDDLIGIEDEIDDLKDEWPELFEKKRSRDDDDDDRDTRRRRIPRADVRSGGGRGSRGDRKEKTATEIQAERLSAWASK